MKESLVVSKFDRLVECGLVLYDDKQQTIEHIDGDLKFQFILTAALTKKPTLTPAQPQLETNITQRPEKQEGSDISTTGFEITTTDTHIVIANKFSFSRPHLMLLTLDEHRRQYEPLDEADLDGVWRILNAAETDYVAFYNCGRDGGCSRLHKHLQVMPLPANSFAAFLDSPEGQEAETKVPFEWFYRRFAGEVDSTVLVGVYHDLLREATKVGGGRGEHVASAPSGAACPHNMILTKRWMIVLPRRRGAVNKEAGVNSLGMLGVIAVATTKEIDKWVSLGLTESLAELGVPKKI
ncbi:hypothetical protein BDV32DRAFT_136216 [Aspergillus pseudonomiae]|uniref:Uncharacterized protein n=1 Tax=Aspergillus pseudonomiae TaxID=1506151 RepID=A0A5N6I9S6_9EURO|nr:uncharacterized protein BDV37DRAFT_278608 [Aspergillus pseudonomiae]KAB8263158.1 hypothetical protein BDV32DRAFT_136216 [Aspergillus pseudonomiae]KAE8408596.1 hypothetical protein BDV37DRAFT_278608 [Aspergillus pseudonomiae]